MVLYLQVLRQLRKLKIFLRPLRLSLSFDKVFKLGVLLALYFISYSLLLIGLALIEINSKIDMFEIVDRVWK
jgi:hypothetical protein